MQHNRDANGFHSTISCKPYLSLTEKYGEISWRHLKGALGLLLLSSFLWVGYALAAGQPPWKHPEIIHIQLDQFNHAEQPVGSPSGSAINETDISHILFGIGGSAGTWPTRRRYSELWWEPNRTRGSVWFDETPNVTWDGAGPAHQVSENASQFPYTCWYGSRAAVRLARVLVESVRLKEKDVRWYVIGDDDTVFFTENLVSVLSKYDHEEMYYIGGVSESVEQDVIHSYGMAFGGGGFAVSYVLAEELARIFDGCLHRYASFYGSDQRVGACVNELGVPLTRELGFHQLDVRGEAYGLLAAHPVTPLVTLHHLDYVKRIFPFSPTQLDAVDRLVAASRADPGRVLQQSFGYVRETNWSVSVSWGYTAQLYPRILTAKELGTVMQTFVSWRSWSPGPFTFDTRSWEQDVCRQPLLYFLERVEEPGDGSGGTITVYQRFDDLDRPNCNQTEYEQAREVRWIEVSSPKMGLGEWKKAPRRYCTEIGGDVKGGSITMKLRKCGAGDNLSPP